MLSYLRVENLAVVEKVELNFSTRLNILTGETGAGKSILIDAIQLLTSKKIPANIIRNGKEQLIVEALFVKDDEEFILKRQVEKNKSVSFFNGAVAPFSQVRNKAAELLNIYGQKDHIFLLNTANQQLYLDQFAQNEKLLAQIAEKYQHLKRIAGELQELVQKKTQAAERVDYLNFQLQEIENLSLKKGDEQRLEERLKILASAETILSKAETLIQELYQKDPSVYTILAQNLPHIDYLRSMFPELAAQREEISKFYDLIPEISASLNTLSGKLEYNENELNEIAEKLAKLGQLKKKHNLDFDGLLEKFTLMQRERDELLNLNFYLQDKEKEIAAALAEYRELNLQLRQRRRESAARLSALILKELALLEMKKAQFEVRVEELEPQLENISERGTDHGEFYFSSNPGQPPGKLTEVASGGELSRLMLVLKSIIRDEKNSTYIFDEIDAGIGGKTAEFVGEKLRQIARENQVICISHLPQIACFADRHFLIDKQFIDNQTFSSAKVLERQEKVAEIARLMAGSVINPDVLKAAELLLDKNRQ